MTFDTYSERLSFWLARRVPDPWLYLGSILTVVALVFLQHRFASVDMAVFFVLPAALAGWFGGKKEGVLISLLSALACLANEYSWTMQPLTLMLAANFAGKLAFFSLIGYLVAKMAALRRNTRHIVEAFERGDYVCICAWCQRIKDNEGKWNTPQEYLRQSTHGHLTHGICPACQSHTASVPRTGSMPVHPPPKTRTGSTAGTPMNGLSWSAPKPTNLLQPRNH